MWRTEQTQPQEDLEGFRVQGLGFREDVGGRCPVKGFPSLPKSCRGYAKLGVPFWGPHNKDCSIFGSILGSPYLGKLPV